MKKLEPSGPVDLETIQDLILEEYHTKTSVGEITLEVSALLNDFVQEVYVSIPSQNFSKVDTKKLVYILSLVSKLKGQSLGQPFYEVYMELDPHLDQNTGTLH